MAEDRNRIVRKAGKTVKTLSFEKWRPPPRSWPWLAWRAPPNVSGVCGMAKNSQQMFRQRSTTEPRFRR
jgi:hypothetical protein